MKIIRENKTIEETRSLELCTGCGTCVGVCPNSAVEMVRNIEGIYDPRLNIEQCNECGICFRVCPGHSVDFKELNLAIFNRKREDTLIGNYINCYIGHSTDLDIRYNSASGGLVTTLLLFAIEEGIIDGALLTKMNDKNPLQPEVFIAETGREIISASKSKYCPVPVNIALKEILKKDGKFAVVGLPCHIHGIRKAEMLNKKFEKIILHFGLSCRNASTFLATEYLLRKMKINKQDVKKLDYRGEGWPGGMTITLKDGSRKFIPLFSLLFKGGVFKSYFIPQRCVLCSDKSNELSDISFGDPHRLSDDKIGESLVISRNRTGEELLQNAVSSKKIELRKIDSDKVEQSIALYPIKKRLKARIFFSKIRGKKVPFHNEQLQQSSFSDYLNAILLYMQLNISSKKYLWSLLDLHIVLLKTMSYFKHSLERITS